MAKTLEQERLAFEEDARRLEERRRRLEEKEREQAILTVERSGLLKLEAKRLAALTDRIKTLQDHFADHKHDHSSRRGLLAMVSRRNSLLRYLQRKNRDSYLETIKKLGLRK